MARTNKNTTALVSTLTEQTAGKGHNSAKASAAAVMELIAKAITGVKSFVQQVEKLEPLMADAALACLNHAREHGDCTLADRLVKEIPVHPATKALKAELVDWFRQNSPIRWNAQSEVSMDKERGWKEDDLDKANDKAFYETTRAVNARDASQRAHANALTPITVETVLNRIRGIRKFVISATEKNKDGVVRGIGTKLGEVNRTEKKKIMEVLNKMEEAVLPKDEEAEAA